MRNFAQDRIRAAARVAARCECDGTTAGCCLHGLCQYCMEAMGVAYDVAEPGRKRRWWACAACLALCRECGENPHSPLCPEHPERKRERELLEIAHQEQAEENERMGRGMRWFPASWGKKS